MSFPRGFSNSQGLWLKSLLTLEILGLFERFFPLSIDLDKENKMKRKSLELDVIWRLKLANLLKVRDLASWVANLPKEVCVWHWWDVTCVAIYSSQRWAWLAGAEPLVRGPNLWFVIRFVRTFLWFVSSVSRIFFRFVGSVGGEPLGSLWRVRGRTLLSNLWFVWFDYGFISGFHNIWNWF